MSELLFNHGTKIPAETTEEKAPVHKTHGTEMSQVLLKELRQVELSRQWKQLKCAITSADRDMCCTVTRIDGQVQKRVKIRFVASLRFCISLLINENFGANILFCYVLWTEKLLHRMLFVQVDLPIAIFARL
jgi:hypothetical protein